MRSLLYIGLVALCTLPARGDETAEEQTLHTLTVIDSSLTREDLDTLLDDPLETVIHYATDLDYDEGAQLRAIRALPAYCDPRPCERVQDTLRSLIPTGELAQAQITVEWPLLRLRAAIEALGATGTTDEDDIDVLTRLLRHPSRDIRATAVRALSASQAQMDDNIALRCEISAALRTRLGVEPLAQVQIALEDALRLTANDACMLPR